MKFFCFKFIIFLETALGFFFFFEISFDALPRGINVNGKVGM